MNLKRKIRLWINSVKRTGRADYNDNLPDGVYRIYLKEFDELNQILTECFEKSNKRKRMTIQIEICKSSYIKDKWNIRIGGIEGCSECSNISKEEVLDEIKDEMEEITGETECYCYPECDECYKKRLEEIKGER